jgi:hypothetical protein
VTFYVEARSFVDSMDRVSGDRGERDLAYVMWQFVDELDDAASTAAAGVEQSVLGAVGGVGAAYGNRECRGAGAEYAVGRHCV